MNQEEIESLNRSIIHKEIQILIKNISTKKTLKQKHTQTQMNSLINPARYLRININSSQTLSKQKKIHLNSFHDASIILIPSQKKTQQYKKITCQYIL